MASGDVMSTVHISRRTLERYVTSGKLPVVHLPSGHRRYRRSDVEALLSRGNPAAHADNDRPPGL